MDPFGTKGRGSLDMVLLEWVGVGVGIYWCTGRNGELYQSEQHP